MTVPFEGLRVLDLSTEIAGPFATRQLADAGAEIVKIESPAGDPLRRMKTSAVLGRSEPLAEGVDGALFQWLNATKKSAVLDLDGSDADRATFLRLVGSADVVLESFEPGWLDARGIGFDAIREANPRASLVSVTAFGQDGPWASRAATDFTLQAESGSMSGRGYADLGPVVAGGRLGEYCAGSFAAVAAVVAWRSARATGAGRHADVSMLETMILCFQPYQFIHGQMQPGDQFPLSVEVPSIEPTQDGMIGFSTQTSQQWHDLCVMVEQPEWVTDDSLCIGNNRFERRDEILTKIQAWTRTHSIDEIVDLCVQLRIPVAPIGNGETVLETDHLVARGFYRDHPGGFKVPGVPFRFEHGDEVPLGVSPGLGEHTEEVLAGPAKLPSPPAITGAGEKPLSGLKVVDFTAFWAGPFAGTVLADFGADVIKVESIQRPDGMRFASGFIPEDGIVWEWAPVFHGANSGKRSITLNLEDDDGLEFARELVRQADVVIENFSPRVMERFGFDGPAVKALNPDAILVRMPAFGLDGPWRDRVGFAMTIEQASGLAWVTGFPEREPTVPRGICDPVGGMTAVFALLGALEMKARGAGGQTIEVTLLEVGLQLAGEQVVERSAYGVLLEREGNVGPVASPQGVYDCRDERNPGDRGWVAIACATDEQWPALARAIGREDWATDVTLASEPARRARAAEIDEAIASWTTGRHAREISDTLAAVGVPVGWLHNQREVVPGHEQLDARGFLEFLDHPFAGRIGYPRSSVRFDGEPGLRTLPPLLGEHNAELLTERLGQSPEQIRALEEKQVIGTRPSFL